MAGRRRIWLIAAGVLAIVAALAWALSGRDGRMDVQLVFVRYTNYTTTFTNPAPGSRIFTRNVFSAVVMATNTGNVAVELYGIMRMATFYPNGTTIRDDLAQPSGMNLPRVLKPGEAVLVEVEPQRLGVPWYTELMAQRRELSDRLYVKLRTKRGAVMERILTRCLSQPPEMWATLGPITDAPLDKTSVREWIWPYAPPSPAHDLFDDSRY